MALFIFAFLGNFFYVLSIATSPFDTVEERTAFLKVRPRFNPGFESEPIIHVVNTGVCAVPTRQCWDARVRRYDRFAELRLRATARAASALVDRYGEERCAQLWTSVGFVLMTVTVASSEEHEALLASGLVDDEEPSAGRREGV